MGRLTKTNLAKTIMLATVLSTGVLAGASWQRYILGARIEALESSLAETTSQLSLLNQAAFVGQEAARQITPARQLNQPDSARQALASTTPQPDPISPTEPIGAVPAIRNEPNQSKPPRRSTPDQARALARQKFQEFLAATTDSSSRARRGELRSLLESLRELGPYASEALIEELKQADSSRARSSAASLLGSLQDPIALPVLEELIFSEEDTIVRRGVARGLRRMENMDIAPIFEALVADSNEDRFVRFHAAYGLAQLGEPEGVPALVRLFEESQLDGMGRGLLFRTLRRLDDNAALPVMRQILNTPNDIYYQLGALEFLSHHGTSEDAALVQAVMQREAYEPAIVESATKVLARLPQQP